MAFATMTSNGQITIPINVRRRLGLAAGDRVEFVLNEETDRYEVFSATGSVTALKGIISKRVKPVTIEGMNAAIAERGASTK